MARVSGQLKSSVNAGQFAAKLRGRVNVKQYYSAALRMLGVEPVPQSGFRLLPGSVRVGPVASSTVIKGVLKVDKDQSYTLIFTPGSVDIWRNDRVKVATVALPQLTANLIPTLNFYGEADTFGIFVPGIWNGLRLLRNSANDTQWTVSAWPYALLPDVDLGGTYAKTPDVWVFYVRWAEDVAGLVFSFTVEGSSTISVSLLDSVTGLAIAPDSADDADWARLAADIRDAIEDVPGFSAGVSVAFVSRNGRYVTMKVTFGGVLAGQEYQFDAQIANTSEASVLVAHDEIGETAGEPLISVARGGFAGATNYQDRQIYWAPAARPAAIAMSRTGEYFDLNIDSQNDAAARLEALRSETSETVLYVIDATYLVAFTDRGEYFASNRTIKRNEPLNWVRASTIGSKPGCHPALLEGSLYFVSRDGGRLYRNNYDAVGETFTPEPVNDLNDDLVENIKNLLVQRKTGKMKADRLWILREDGRLICGIANVSQDIALGACEWPVAGGGFVHAMAIDGQDQVWLTIERAGVITEELLEEATDNLFQMAVSINTDLAGRASGLSTFNGKTVWALIDGDVFGPYLVTTGSIETDQPSRPAKVGIWTAPWYESLPYVRVLGNDDVVRRPGKVGSLRIYVEDTASIAIGANGRPPKDVPLNRASDDLSQPKKNYTGHLASAGHIGACMDPTIVISQVRPGQLSVRDYIPGVKL